MSTWPKHADGSNLTMGEMSIEQRREQTRLACARLKAELEQPAVQAAIGKILAEFDFRVETPDGPLNQEFLGAQRPRAGEDY